MTILRHPASDREVLIPAAPDLVLRSSSEDQPASVLVQALEGRLTTDDLCVCGKPRAAHFASDNSLLGCAFAARYDRFPRNPMATYGPHTAVTIAVRKALLRDCGPAMQEVCMVLGYDNLLAIANELAKTAVAAYVAELAK